MAEPINLNYATPKPFAVVTQDQFSVFHARGVLNKWKGDRLWRVYVKDGKLFFIRVGGSKQQQAALGAQFGLLGMLIGMWLHKRDAKKTEQKLQEIHSVPPEQLIAGEKENLEYEQRQLSEMSIEPSSFWGGAKIGRLVFRDPAGKKRSLMFEDAASAQSAHAHLSGAMGQALKVNATWDDVKAKFIKKAK